MDKVFFNHLPLLAGFLCFRFLGWVFSIINLAVLKDCKSVTLTKKFENGAKKYFNQLLGAARAQKMVEIHNRS